MLMSVGYRISVSHGMTLFYPCMLVLHSSPKNLSLEHIVQSVVQEIEMLTDITGMFELYILSIPNSVPFLYCLSACQPVALLRWLGRGRGERVSSTSWGNLKSWLFWCRLSRAILGVMAIKRVCCCYEASYSLSEWNSTHYRSSLRWNRGEWFCEIDWDGATGSTRLTSS